MKVVLADLFHDNACVANVDCTPQTVPLAIGYVAASLYEQIDDVEVELFRSVDRKVRSPSEVISRSASTTLIAELISTSPVPEFNVSPVVLAATVV